MRVSRQSPRYFAYDDGRPFFAIGENVCWSGNHTPVADYAAWLKELGAAGGNWARLWLAYNEKGLEWLAPTPKPGTGTFLLTHHTSVACVSPVGDTLDKVESPLFPYPKVILQSSSGVPGGWGWMFRRKLLFNNDLWWKAGYSVCRTQVTEIK